ncbi:hypothetical protein CC78DRAFT_581920 [Lojkania enalia]|uniref:Uncharacterized protein n=1 Tax=Lojkania enalia TaxID=147567 RepID=A0A9P4N240_9PLEO|nr:hypothetical protein CC78DRAFT_581920 [Didymosphaeria enalia]
MENINPTIINDPPASTTTEHVLPPPYKPHHASPYPPSNNPTHPLGSQNPKPETHTNVLRIQITQTHAFNSLNSENFRLRQEIGSLHHCARRLYLALIAALFVVSVWVWVNARVLEKRNRMDAELLGELMLCREVIGEE